MIGISNSHNNAYERIPHYLKIHAWIREKYGRAYYCSVDKSHKSTMFEWANISQEYKYEKKDWRSLCKRCHSRYDKRIMSIEDIDTMLSHDSKGIKVDHITLSLSFKSINRVNRFSLKTNMPVSRIIETLINKAKLSEIVSSVA